MKKTQTKKPQQVIKIGPDALEQLPDLIRQNGTKALLVHGHRPVEDGLLTKVRLLLNKEGVEYANMGQILPNPTYSSVKRGIKIARKEKCDVILALGGGSTLQCVKGIALGMGYKGDVWDFWTGKKKPEKVYPVASILTNPSSGTELSSSCTLVRKGKQETVHIPALECTFAILDPKLSMYPFYPTMDQVFNIFIHLFYGAITLEGQDYQTSIGLLKTLFASASALEKNISDLDARTSLFEVGYKSHADLNIGKCPVESIASDLSFQYSLTIGSAGSALFLAWVKSFDDDQKRKTIKIARDLFGFSTSRFNEALDRFKKELEPTKLALSIPESGLLVSDKELKQMAKNKAEKKILLDANKPEKSDRSETDVDRDDEVKDEKKHDKAKDKEKDSPKAEDSDQNEDQSDAKDQDDEKAYGHKGHGGHGHGHNHGHGNKHHKNHGPHSHHGHPKDHPVNSHDQVQEPESTEPAVASEPAPANPVKEAEKQPENTPTAGE